MSEHANLRYKVGSQEWLKLNANTADAKCRISLYGANAVVSAFASFEKLGATMNTPEQGHAFTDMVMAMRKDVLGSTLVSEADLKTLLLGVQSYK